MNGTDVGAGSAGTDVPLTACVRPTLGPEAMFRCFSRMRVATTSQRAACCAGATGSSRPAARGAHIGRRCPMDCARGLAIKGAVLGSVRLRPALAKELLLA